jgi:hypothetical protein
MADLGSPVLTPTFAPIAGGWFTMGTQLGHEDERPPHEVFVDKFELGVCPVTRAERVLWWTPPSTKSPATGRIRHLHKRISPSSA